jgi:hypothetical protein
MTVETNGANRAQLAEKFDSLCRSLAEYGDLANSLQPSPKQQLIDSMEISQTLADLGGITYEIDKVARNIASSRMSIQNSKKRIEEIRAMVLLSGEIDGKNAEIREAQLLRALREDTSYQTVANQVATSEMALEQWTMDLETLKAKQTAIKIKARLIAAQLEFLAD